MIGHGKASPTLPRASIDPDEEIGLGSNSVLRDDRVHERENCSKSRVTLEILRVDDSLLYCLTRNKTHVFRRQC